MSNIVNKAFSGLLIIPVRIYQYGISPFTPASCRHIPTCSEYSVEALKQHGPVRGSLMALNRISRCHPWGTEGFDPVPKILVTTMKLNKKQTRGVKYYDMLKSKMITLLMLPFIFLTAACNSGTMESGDSGQQKVLVSIQPYQYFIEKIAGDHVKTMVLIPPGTTPHVYDPTPRQMAEIDNVDLYFFNGNLSFEKAWIDKMKNSYPNLKLVNLSNGIPVLHGHKCDDPGHNHEHHGTDPHTWLSARNGKMIAKNVFDGLIGQYPDQKEIFEQNYDKLVEEIDQLDQKIQEILSGLPYRKFMIFHPSLSYFARDYNLEQIAIESGGKEPSPSQLRASIERAKSAGLKTILVQKEFDMENARIIANEIDGIVVEIDPLSVNWDENLLDLAKKISSSPTKK